MKLVFSHSFFCVCYSFQIEWVLWELWKYVKLCLWICEHIDLYSYMDMIRSLQMIHIKWYKITCQQKSNKREKENNKFDINVICARQHFGFFFNSKKTPIWHELHTAYGNLSNSHLFEMCKFIKFKSCIKRQLAGWIALWNRL